MRLFRKRVFRNGYVEFNFECLISKKNDSYFESNFEYSSFEKIVGNFVTNVLCGFNRI
jgi:hypothetical protein